MELKKMYDRKEQADGTHALLFKGVQVRHYGKKQKFSPQTLLNGQAEGWLKFEGGVITVLGLNKHVSYRVVRTPGYYCCHDGARLEGDPSIPDGPEGAARRKAYVEKNFPGAKSPDSENPSGYMGTNSYKGVLVGAKEVISA